MIVVVDANLKNSASVLLTIKSIKCFLPLVMMTQVDDDTGR